MASIPIDSNKYNLSFLKNEFIYVEDFKGEYLVLKDSEDDKLIYVPKNINILGFPNLIVIKRGDGFIGHNSEYNISQNKKYYFIDKLVGEGKIYKFGNFSVLLIEK